MIEVSNFIYNEENINQAINLIYKVFLEFNYQNATDKMRSRMQSLYGDGSNYQKTLVHLKKSDIFLVVMDAGKIIGLVRGKKDKIINLYVDGIYQGKGIGKSLLETFESYAKKLGLMGIILKPSQYAQSFYLQNGYIFINEKYMKKNI